MPPTNLPTCGGRDRHSRHLLAGVALALASLVAAACGREPTGVGGRGVAEVRLDPLFQTSPPMSDDDVTAVRFRVYVINTALPATNPNRRREIRSVTIDPEDARFVTETETHITFRIEFPLQGGNSVYEVEGDALSPAGVKLFELVSVQFTEAQVTSSGGVTVNTEAVYVGPGANATKIVLSPAVMTLRPGQEGQFTAQVFGPNDQVVTGAPLRWRTSNNAVVHFPDQRGGRVRATGQVGTAQVTADIEGVAGVAGTATVNVVLTPTALQLVAGAGQSAAAGTQLAAPIRVRLVSDNVPVPGAQVTFSAGQSGSVAPQTASTNSNGEAEARWTLGAAPGTQTLTVSSAGVPNLVVSASATVPPTTVSFAQLLPTMVAGTSQTGTVQVLQNGAPLGGATVLFSTTGSATWTPSTASTNSSGQASSTFSATVAGTYTVTATASSGTNVLASVQTTVVVTSANVVTQLVKVSGDNQTVARGQNFGQPIVVEARNSQGSPVPGVDLDFDALGGTTRVTTASNGRASVVYTVSALSPTGSASITVRLVSNPSISVTFTFTVVP